MENIRSIYNENNYEYYNNYDSAGDNNFELYACVERMYRKLVP